MEIIFWICVSGILYAYIGYPAALAVIKRVTRARSTDRLFAPDDAPGVTLIIPAHNEAGVIERKVQNSLSLYYPGEWQVVVVSDGSTDDTSKLVRSFSASSRLTFVDLPDRKGKANALNKGVEAADGEIVVFSDASITLEETALWEIVRPFSDPSVGCVSGEDKIAGGSGEGLYGRYELYLRRQESAIGSIVGASGSIYAQRKHLVTLFPEGVAPDFLSVLNSVQEGFRAVSTSKAVGHMTALAESKKEFQRKVRTIIRGMTALFRRKSLLNPIRFPLFSFFLISHKLVRWIVPFFLVGLFVSSLYISDQVFYRIALIGQLVFYGASLAAYASARLINRLPLLRVALYFCVSNTAIMVGWVKYLRGVRQEIWGPSNRAH